VQLVGDVGRLRQVVVNLVGNAVKFTERGRVWMNVGGQREEDSAPWRLRFEVADDGPGIPPDQLAKIFDPFRQVDGSASRKQGGAGLGLTISLKIAERMGGSIEVRSQVGVGSTFVLHVPFLEAEPASGKTERRPTAGSSTMQRILVAEDNLVNQTLAKRMLEKLGHRVWLASDGQAAVDMALNQRFDLVFMDIQMPNLDGFAAARAIRAAGFERVPIIAMTAHAMAGDREACLAAGMTDYVAKPITFESLAAVIARAQPSLPPPVKTGEVPSEAPISTPPSVRS
jgi:CheY-like chemotaxis protein